MCISLRYLYVTAVLRPVTTLSFFCVWRSAYGGIQICFHFSKYYDYHSSLLQSLLGNFRRSSSELLVFLTFTRTAFNEHVDD